MENERGFNIGKEGMSSLARKAGEKEGKEYDFLERGRERKVNLDFTNEINCGSDKTC